jgi:hypothetical protein
VRELMFVLIATRPEFKTARDCRRKLVGPMRRYLVRHDGKELSAISGALPALPPHAAELIGQRLAAASELAEFCARCGRCDEEKILR